MENTRIIIDCIPEIQRNKVLHTHYLRGNLMNTKKRNKWTPIIAGMIAMIRMAGDEHFGTPASSGAAVCCEIGS